MRAETQPRPKRSLYSRCSVLNKVREPDPKLKVLSARDQLNNLNPLVEVVPVKEQLNSGKVIYPFSPLAPLLAILLRFIATERFPNVIHAKPDIRLHLTQHDNKNIILLLPS